MKTEKKHNGSLWARVALMLALMMVYTLSASALDVSCTIDINMGEDDDIYTCDGGTVTKSGSNLSITTNESWTIYSVQGVKSNTTYYEEISGSVAPSSEYYVFNCSNYTSVKVTFRVKSDNVVVTFDMNGYGGDAPIAQNLTFGQTVVKPTDPTEDELEFGGWFTDAACTVPFDFTTPLGVNTPNSSFTGGNNPHFNLTLYAKWLAYQWGKCGKVDEQAGLDGSEVTWSGYKDADSGVCDEITISGSGEIMQDAFYGNKNLRSVVINDGVTSIGQAAFRGCSGLTSVTIPASVTSIGQDAFLGCEGLTSVNIPASVTSIGQGAFRSCSGLTSVTIPTSVTSIGIYAFQSCTGLTSVTIPNSVTSIDRDAFLGCSGLTSVTIPASVTSIGQGAFYGCWGMRSLSIPASVTSIGQEAFYNCSALTSVTIPASVTSIGQRAFFKCFSLASVTIYAPLLITYGPNAFDGNADSRNIYVFSNCVDTYKAGWSKQSFVGAIVGIPEGNLSVNTTVNANPQATDEYWSTYYHPTANVKIKTDGVEIYKATLNNTKTAVTLTKVEGNVIKAGQAVMLKTNTSGTILMELTPVLPTGDYSDNDLKGGSTVPTGYNAYTLAAEDDQLGFYNFNGDGLNASKAHLEIPQGSTSGVREFIGFDAGDGETTGIKDINLPPGGSQSPVWRGASGYTLDGRRLSGKPTAKGIYIVKGRKLVIK